ncbi:MAG: flagellar biosynthesis protein FlhF [Clostridium sp.]
MIIKRYLARTMKEALNKIGEELGKEAVIISQRKIKRPGIKGFFSSKIFEVTAANDSKETSIKEKQDTGSSVLLKEVEEMKSMMSTLMVNSNKVAFQGTEEKTEIHNLLQDLDVEDEIIESIMDSLSKSESKEMWKDNLTEIFKGMLSVQVPTMEGTVALIGPTGVGKTTSIAKMAGKLALIDKKKVGLITVDTYRIGAVDQLKTYAEIMNIPFKVVFSIGEMESAVDSMKGCDVILVDTTGRSSKNTMQISELRAYIDKAKASETHLVISATTKNKDIKIITEGYKPLNYDYVIITKLDETSTYGSILNICYKAKAPISFITTGQNVPEDIKTPTENEVINLILGEISIC